MSLQTPDRQLTEAFFCETAPTFFGVTELTQIEAAYEEYAGRVDELAGTRGEYDSRLAWDIVHNVAQELAPVDTDEQLRLSELAWLAGRTSFYASNSADSFQHLVSATRAGSLVLVDAKGHVKSGTSKPNPEVDPIYGSPDPYVLEKLGWAKVGEVLAKQGADWGEGYEILTDFLRRIGRIGGAALPHVGMATAHEVVFRETTRGTNRNALAYASASNFTFTDSSIARLMSSPTYASIRTRDEARGLVTNQKDWLAGRLDSQIASAANDLYLGRNISVAFPDLTHPDYVNVDNN